MDILNRIYRQFEPLDPFWLDFSTEFHSGRDKKIFSEQKHEGYIPVYNSACIWQYDCNYWLTTNDKHDKPRHWLTPEQYDAYLLNREISHLIDDIATQSDCDAQQEKIVLAALSLQPRKELTKFAVTDRNFYRLAYRRIASNPTKRSLIAAVLPPNICALDSLFVSIPKYYRLENGSIKIKVVPIKRIFLAQALFNSIVIDWILRFFVTTNIGKAPIFQLPVPQPDELELSDNPIYYDLIKNSLMLSCYYKPDAFLPLMREFGYSENELPANPNQARLLKLCNDILVARLYGINRSQMKQIVNNLISIHKDLFSYGQSLINMM